MKPFCFKEFSILQSKDVFRVGTDGVLLGAMASVNKAEKILEVGTGTGLISLMLSQRNVSAKILALDIDESSVKLAAQNFHASPFSDRLAVRQQDFKKIEINHKYDLIVSNPPYFEKNTSEKDVLARQTIELSFENLIQKTCQLLSVQGFFSVIIPVEAGQEFINICSDNHLFLIRKVVVYGIINSKPKRLVLEFSFTKQELKEEILVIEKKPRIYSDQYLELTKKFHVFHK